MSDRPLAYFLTFTTYGARLHGDERGTIDSEHRFVGQEPIAQNDVRRDWERAEMRSGPFVLDARRRASVDESIRGVCAHREWKLHALNVRTNHVHVVVSADRTPEQAMVTFKAWATRRMIEAGLVIRRERVWTKHGSTRYLWTEEAVHAASVYTVQGQGSSLTGAPSWFATESAPPSEAGA